MADPQREMIVLVANDGDFRAAQVDFDHAEPAEQQVAGRDAKRPVLQRADLLPTRTGDADAVEVQPQHRMEPVPFDPGFGQLDVEAEVGVVDRLLEIGADEARLDRRGGQPPDRDRHQNQHAADQDSGDFQQKTAGLMYHRPVYHQPVRRFIQTLS